MKAISLFSGAGISDVGMEQAGVTTVAQVEINKHANNVRKKHFAGIEHYEDIRAFDAVRFRGTVNMVTGGFPCQDYSMAGNRAGISGDRGALFWELARVIDEVRPNILCLENVPGLLSSGGGESFRVIVNTLVKLGFCVGWRVLDLQNFGVPQRRKRLLIAGARVAGGPGGRAIMGLFEPEGLQGDSPKGRKAWQDHSTIIGTLSASGGGTARPAGNANELDFLLPHIVDFASITSKVNRSTPSSNTCPTVAAQSQVMCFGWNNSPSRAMEVADYSPTLLASSSSNPAVLHEAQVRKLMPVECERLMGLPDDYTRWGADGTEILNCHRYTMLGNGWSVPQAKWLAEKVQGL